MARIEQRHVVICELLHEHVKARTKGIVAAEHGGNNSGDGKGGGDDKSSGDGKSDDDGIGGSSSGGGSRAAIVFVQSLLGLQVKYDKLLADAFSTEQLQLSSAPHGVHRTTSPDPAFVKSVSSAMQLAIIGVPRAPE